MLYARKHRRVSISKAPVVTEQKSALLVHAIGRTSPQLPSVSTEAKSVSRDAKQVPRKPKATQTKQVWKAKQKVLREALDEVEALLELRFWW